MSKPSGGAADYRAGGGFRTLTPADMSAWRERSEPDFEGYTYFQRNAIIHYMGMGYDEINRYLREGISPEDEDAFFAVKLEIEALDEAVNQGARLKESVVLHRGAYYSPLYQQLRDGQAGPGTVLTDKGFVSTSLLRETAFTGGYHGIVYRIRAKKGSKVIDGSSNNKDENEIILPRGSRFKIRKITQRLDEYELEVDLL